MALPCAPPGAFFDVRQQLRVDPQRSILARALAVNGVVLAQICRHGFSLFYPVCVLTARTAVVCAQITWGVLCVQSHSD